MSLPAFRQYSYREALYRIIKKNKKKNLRLGGREGR